MSRKDARADVRLTVLRPDERGDELLVCIAYFFGIHWSANSNSHHTLDNGTFSDDIRRHLRK
jgi:hypothetical protein